MASKPRKTLVQMLDETIAEPRRTTNRRKKRPEGKIHESEIRAILTAAAPTGMKALVVAETMYQRNYLDYSFMIDRSVGQPRYRDDALNSIYWGSDFTYMDDMGWAEDMGHVRGQFERLDRRLAELRSKVMFYYKRYRALNYSATASEPPSLKGTPRRTVKPGNFEAWYEAKQGSRHSKYVDVIAQMPDVPTNLESSRTWGMEIEVAGARGVECPAGWDWTEDGSLRSPYNTEDCECSCEYCTDYEDHDCGYAECGGNGTEDCKEFVSPILGSMFDSGITEICEGARFEPQNATAGVHVHVGTDGMTPKQIGGLVYAYGLLETMLEPSYHREDREYCEALYARDVQRVLKEARTALHRENMDVLDRYVTVNVQALSKHGTIEFRAMGPVYEGEYLHKWAMFCREMVNVAASGAPMKVWDSVKSFDDVLDIFRKYGKEVKEIEADALVAA